MSVALLDTVADLDAAWIESALQAGGHPDARVASIEHEPIGAGNVSDTVRVAITYASGSGPDAVVVKFRPSVPEIHEHGLGSGAYHREIGGYRAIAERDACRIPRTYFVDGDETNINLVMEDLTRSTTPGDQIAGCGPAEAKAVITEFAKLHSTFFPLTDATAPAWLIRLPDVCDYWSDHTRNGAAAALERFASDLDEAGLAAVAEGADLVRDWYLLSQEHQTLTHGDPRVDIVLFVERDGGVGAVIIDWQVTGLRNPMYDVGYFLSGSVTVEDRRAHEDDLLAHYIATFDGGYDLETATADYDVQLLSGLFITLAAIDVLPDNDVVNRLILALLQRNCAAAIDRGSMAATRALL